MGILALCMLIVMNFILQSTLLQYFRFFDVLPNTTLIIVVALAILGGKNRGAIIGLFAGLLQDVLIGNMIGANALIYMLIGYGVGTLENTIFKDNRIIPIVFTLLSTGVYHLLFFSIMYIAYNKVDFQVILQKIIIGEMLYNSVISFFVYRKLYEFASHPKIKIKIR